MQQKKKSFTAHGASVMARVSMVANGTGTFISLLIALVMEATESIQRYTGATKLNERDNNWKNVWPHFQREGMEYP